MKFSLFQFENKKRQQSNDGLLTFSLKKPIVISLS